MGVEYLHYVVPADRTHAPDAARVAQLVETFRRERYVFAPDHPHFAERLSERMTALPYEATGGHAFRAMENPNAPRPMKIAEAAIVVPAPVTAEWIASQRDAGSTDAQDDELALAFPVMVHDDRFESFEDMGIRYPFTFGGDEPLYHEVVVHLARDFVHHSSENTDPIDTHCTCGAELGYEPEESARRRLAIRCESRIRAACTHCRRPFDPSDVQGRRTSGYTGKPLPPLAGGGAYRFAVIIDCGKGWPMDRGEIVIAPAFVELVASVLGQRLVDFGELH